MLYLNARKFHLYREGAILACRVTLGGRLCTSKELRNEDQTKISQLKKDLRTQLTATVIGAGIGVDAGIARQQGSQRNESRVQHDEASRMVLETQGGNGLLASR